MHSLPTAYPVTTEDPVTTLTLTGSNTPLGTRVRYLFLFSYISNSYHDIDGGHNILEAFSPAVEKEFSSAKFLVDLQVCMQKGVTHAKVFRLEKPA